MDLQTGLVCVGVVVISAAVILLVSMFGIKEKSYEEAIAEQRKLPDDLLLGKKDKGKEKKHKNKAGKKVKEKKEEKDEKEEEKSEHVQFEETPEILPSEPSTQESGKGSKKKNKVEKVKPILINKDEPVVIAPELSPSQPPLEEANHFDLIQPKDDLELIRSHSRENLQQMSQSEPIVNKSPKETPTRSKKNSKEVSKKRDESKDEKKEVVTSASAPQQISKELIKDVKEQQKETPVKESKEVAKETALPVQSSVKETKSKKKKNDILAQIGGDKDGVNVSLLMPLVQKAELSRSEIQILIDQLLNKQLDNPLEHSEWTEGRADPVIKLKKQLAEREKALADEHEASVAFQNKLKELRAELNAERSRLSASVRQLEEALNAKVTEAQTLHTRMQHILESHAAEKQGFARQIEQLQSKVNEDAAIIHKMKEDQGQTQGHMQQELIAQRKQLEAQYAQMRDNENALKAQLSQKHAEVQELQNVSLTVSQELQVTCENSTAEIEMLRQQLSIMQDQLMHSESQLQHFKEAGDRLQDMARQLEESHRAKADLDHRLQTAHRHQQELQKQVNTIKAELNVAKTEGSEAVAVKAEFNKVQSELMKLKSDLSLSQIEVKSEADEITTLKTLLVGKEDELKQVQSMLNNSQEELQKSQAEFKRVEAELNSIQEKSKKATSELVKAHDDLKQAQNELTKAEHDLTNTSAELSKIQGELFKAQADLKASNVTVEELRNLKAEFDRLQQGGKKSDDAHLQVMRLQEENERLSAQLGNVAELQKELEHLRHEKDTLESRLAAITERPAAEGRENGIEEKTQKNNVQHLEHDQLAEQRNFKLDNLTHELRQKETELVKLNAQVETLRSDVNNQRSLVKRLQDDLDAQRAKNNELRTKNWKVMEALSAAEYRAKTNTEKSADELIQKAQSEEQETTKALLQRIFPEIKVSEKSHEKWVNAFEERVYAALIELRKKQEVPQGNPDLESQNQNLQGMVSHYKQIIDDTESMLNKLQSHIESEETRWQAQLRQKENEVANLRVELNDLRNKSTVSEKLQQKISELEARLAEEESLREEAKAELLALRAAHKPSPTKGGHSHDLAALEQLQEEKARLSEELQSESSKRATLDAEVIKLRSLVETSESSLVQEKNLVSQLQQEVTQLKSEVCGGSSSSDQSTLNGPPTSDSPKSEPTLAAQSLLAALEKTFKNTELANCSITEPINSLQSQAENDNRSLTSKISPKTCHTTDHNTQASWNPLNGQQHKKHKKKRKGGSGKK
ncbi:kinectin isoform X4 [Cephus cinctus]|uniref:Kinectin isoform X4 n=1 Tax=Cephus cinctus TaxID=211228 RepID=A0AAJ7BZB3_CEPCN|nr:kinectin isoform X4 [Cephus cinctus]